MYNYFLKCTTILYMCYNLKAKSKHVFETILHKSLTTIHTKNKPTMQESPGLNEISKKYINLQL